MTKTPQVFIGGAQGPTAPEQDMGLWLQQFYAANETLPDEFLLDRQDMPAQQRD